MSNFLAHDFPPSPDMPGFMRGNVKLEQKSSFFYPDLANNIKVTFHKTATEIKTEKARR